MLVETQTAPLKKALSTNSTSVAFPSRVPQFAEPGGFEMGTPEGFGGAVQNLLLFLPYAVSADNGTFSMRVIGWRRVGGNPATQLWVPVILLEVACVCCAVVGLTGGEIAATERFVDTITLVTGNDDVSTDIVSPTGDVIGHVVIDGKGFQKIETTFVITSGPTSMNALVSAY